MKLYQRAAIVSALVTVPFIASALSTDEIYRESFSLFNQIISLQKRLITELDSQVVDLMSQLTTAKNELSLSKGVLNSSNTQLLDLTNTKSKLLSTESDLANVRIQLKSTQDELIACRTPVQKTTSCVWNGVTYSEGTIMPFTTLLGWTLQSQAAIPASAMQLCVACGGTYMQYKCQNGDWIKISTGYTGPPYAMKPVIYLYPKTVQKVTVQLIYHGELASTYPPYDPSIGGWKVIARPDGTLTNLADGKEYSYLFWEGKEYSFPIDESKGFVVKGSETREFLQTMLSKMGLLPREYNEFIVFWLPKMEQNKYNFIQFVGKEYVDAAPLTINPKPDSVLRVFMAFKSLDAYKKVIPQVMPLFERKGFTVVEWGGTELRSQTVPDIL